jgi:hypothetical protein
MLAASAPEYDPPAVRPAYLDELQNWDLSFVRVPGARQDARPDTPPDARPGASQGERADAQKAAEKTRSASAGTPPAGAQSVTGA